MKILNSFLLSTMMIGSVLADESMLSNTKLDILNYSYQKSIEDSSKLNKDWINPIVYKYTYNKSEFYTTSESFISISQPIFKSGGIYYAIKYASSMEEYSNTSIDVQKKELIKQVVSLVFQLNKLDVNIQKQKLLIANAKLDIERKQEQVLNGILDTSFLDNAILDSNIKQNVLIDLEYQKESLVNNLTVISDKEYLNMKVPVLGLLESEKFIENNIYIKKAKEDIETSYWMKNMMIANYLPTFNFTGSYSKYHDAGNNPKLNEDSTSNIGFNITMPLDIKFSNTTESSKIDYLKKKSLLTDQKKQELVVYKNTISKIKSLNKKIEIASSDMKLYEVLLTQMNEQLSVGMKTQSDVDTLANSKEIKKLDAKSLKIDIQVELLEVYSRMQIGKGQ